MAHFEIKSVVVVSQNQPGWPQVVSKPMTYNAAKRVVKSAGKSGYIAPKHLAPGIQSTIARHSKK